MLIPWLPDTAPAVHPFIVVLGALFLDALIGDPSWLPHPIAGLGRIIAWGEAALNRGNARIARGALLVVLVVGGSALLGLAIALGARSLPQPWGLGLEVVVGSILLAFRGLYVHVRRVAEGLETGIEEGRRAVGRIVGRKTERLDAAAVSRAAIESAAENFSDGVLAPVFWFALLGLPGLFAYKAINTLDSMIAYRNERFLEFGRVAARLDDAANWIPARIAGTLIALASVTEVGRALTIMLRDAGKQASPNAGWPESAMAGAMGLSLCGPCEYDGKHIDGAWLGDGRTDATPEDIRESLLIMRRATLFAALILTVGAM